MATVICPLLLGAIPQTRVVKMYRAVLSVLACLTMLSACGGGGETGPLLDPDNEAPVISLRGSAVIELEQGQPFEEPGYTAVDAEDGSLTDQVSVQPASIDTNVPGEYELVYRVTDSDLASTSATRTVIVIARENTAPSIQLLGANPLALPFKSEFSDPGATAQDEEDGDISASISVQVNVDTAVAGTHSVIYNVVDSDGASARVTRVVTVGPNQSPSISLVGPAQLSVVAGSDFDFSTLSAEASDPEDGALPVNVSVADLSVLTPGLHHIVYSAQDEEGQTVSAIRELTVLAAEVSLDLNGADMITISLGDSYEEPGYIATSPLGTDASDEVVVVGEVQAKMGVYELHYRYEPTGLNVLEASRTVIVDNPRCSESCSAGCIQFAQNAMSCAADVPSALKLESAVAIEASQNDCLAPCGVHFKAEVSGDFDVELPYFHLAYHWDFGDVGSYFQSHTQDFEFTRYANHAQGPLAAHVFEEPGTYTVTLRVAAKNGRYDELTQEIRVIDPFDHFPESVRFCVSFDSNFEGCPSGAGQLSDWDSVISNAQNIDDVHMLFRAGERFVIPPGRILLREGRSVWARFGEGENPVFELDHDSTVLATREVDEISISYIDLEGSYDAATGLGFSWDNSGFYFGSASTISNNVTLFRTRLSGLYTCFNPRGVRGMVMADNVCTNWYNFGSLASDSSKHAYVGNVIRQKLDAHSGVGEKTQPYAEWLSDGAQTEFAYLAESQGGSFSSSHQDSDVAVWLIERDADEVHLERNILAQGSDYSIDIEAGSVTLAEPADEGLLVFIEQKKWADHGPIRDSDSFETVVSRNDMFSNVGWFANGDSHQPPLRMNTSGVAGASAVISENLMEGGDMVAVLESANPGIAVNPGNGILFERNKLIGSSTTYYTFRSAFGNVSVRNNLLLHADILPTFNNLWGGILFWENFRAGNGSDPDNFDLPVEVHHNSIVNYADDSIGEGGGPAFVDYTAVMNDSNGLPSSVDPIFTDFTSAANLIYAPNTANTEYHSDPLFLNDERYTPTALSPEDNDLPGLFDDYHGNARALVPQVLDGAVEQ